MQSHQYVGSSSQTPVAHGAPAPFATSTTATTASPATNATDFFNSLRSNDEKDGEIADEENDMPFLRDIVRDLNDNDIKNKNKNDNNNDNSDALDLILNLASQPVIDPLKMRRSPGDNGDELYHEGQNPHAGVTGIYYVYTCDLLYVPLALGSVSSHFCLYCKCFAQKVVLVQVTLVTVEIKLKPMQE